jgi:hypothetical protein
MKTRLPFLNPATARGSMVRYLMTTESGQPTNTSAVAVATNMRPFQAAAQIQAVPGSPS